MDEARAARIAAELKACRRSSEVKKIRARLSNADAQQVIRHESIDRLDRCVLSLMSKFDADLIDQEFYPGDIMEAPNGR